MKIILKNTAAIPGLANLVAVPIQDISKIKTISPLGQIEYINIVLKDNADFYHFQAALDSHSSMIRTVKNNAGVYYNGRFNCFVAGMSASNYDVLDKMKQQTFVVIYQDYNNQLRCFGDPEIGLNIEINEQSSPRVGCRIVFSGDAIYKPLNVKTIEHADWDIEHPDIPYTLTVSKDPDFSFILAYYKEIENTNTFSIHTSISFVTPPPPGYICSFDKWVVVSGAVPTGLPGVDYDPSIPEQFIQISSNLKLRAEWIITKAT